MLPSGSGGVSRKPRFPLWLPSLLPDFIDYASVPFVLLTVLLKCPCVDHIEIPVSGAESCLILRLRGTVVWAAAEVHQTGAVRTNSTAHPCIATS